MNQNKVFVLSDNKVALSERFITPHIKNLSYTTIYNIQGRHRNETGVWLSDKLFSSEAETVAEGLPPVMQPHYSFQHATDFEKQLA